MSAAVNGAMHDDAPCKPYRFVHAPGLLESSAFDRRIGRVGPRWEPSRVSVNMKLAVTAARRRSRHRHAWIAIPFVYFFAVCRSHGFSPECTETRVLGALA